MVLTYDANGNQATATDALNRTSSVSRDSAGNITSSTNAKSQTTRYEFDLLNRLRAVVTPKGERTEYTYLPTGELSQIKDPIGNLTTFNYNSLGQLTQKTDPLGFSITRQYDASGNVSQEIDPNGNVKTFTYNERNQLATKTLPDNTIALGYDDNGNVTSATNNESFVTMHYDSLNRLTSTEVGGRGALAGVLPSESLAYGYDFNGNRTSMTDSVGVTSYVYDEADRLASLTNPKNEVFTFTWDSLNRPLTQTRPGSETEYTFNDVNALTGISHSSGGTVIASHGYTRDRINQVTGIQSTAGSSSNSKSIDYDLNNQLTSMTNPEAPASHQAETFSYDSVYNRSSDQGGSYTYDLKKQRLIEDYRYFYYFDNNGNMTKKQAKAGFPNSEVVNYSYSSENQLVGIQFFAAGATTPWKTASYTYDALGRRVRKSVVDTTAPSDVTKTFVRNYAYDNQEMVLEYNGGNQLLARHTHSGLRTDDVLSSDVTSSGVAAGVAQSMGKYMYLKDQQGTIMEVADGSGIRLMHYVYSAFGKILEIQDANGDELSGASPLRTHFSFTGREFDSESGLYYYRARYYSSEIGRFVQKDPEPGKIDAPITVTNQYAYSGNNAANHSDPTGRLFFFDDIIAATFAGISLFTSFTGALSDGTILNFLFPMLVFSDPEKFVSASLVWGSFQAPGLLWSLGSLGSLPGFTIQFGASVVTNSPLGALAGGGFAPGGAIFLSHGNVTGKHFRHEYGHIRQNRIYGGYISAYRFATGLLGGEGPNDFECEAGQLARNYFNPNGAPYHEGYDTNYPTSCTGLGYR